ncbi:MAG: hypothetical protein GEV09_11165 [Pseudonocardiaceae bacterium]|nr:hypothetical protein [Pseudonocardiaceae bacterium]
MWQPRFPGAELVGAAADLLPSIAAAAGRAAEISEGPRWEIVVSPGVLRVRTRDYARAERTHERQLRHHRADVDIAASYLVDGEEPAELLPTRGTITAWSPKSRARMIARLSDLDYTRLYGRYRTCHSCGRDYDPDGDRCPVCKHTGSTLTDRSGRLPAMVTLTYPGDWLTVAPDAESVTEHFAALAKRYARAWGEDLIGPWKKEFQARGAPHLHLSTTPPMGFTTVTDPDTGQRREVDFKTWLSITWADIVAHPDPKQRRKHRAAGTGVDYAEGIRLTDPRRMAVYFAKYGTAHGKDYQHRVPDEWISCYLLCESCGRDYDTDHDECPDCGHPDAEVVELGSAGRFWGYRGLRPVLAARHVTPANGVRAGRVLRRWYKAKGLTKRVRRPRVDQATGRVTYRTTTTRRQLFADNRGFIVVNDAPAMASQLARYLATVPRPTQRAAEAWVSSSSV